MKTEYKIKTKNVKKLFKYIILQKKKNSDGKRNIR